jgi:hypothetical protein
MIKKLLLVSITFILLTGDSKYLMAQAHERGNVFTNAGIIWGMRGYNYSDISSNVLANLSMDYALSESVSLGAQYGKSLFNRENGSFDNSMSLYAVRLGFHLSSSDYFDPYINLSLGTMTNNYNSYYGIVYDNYTVLGVNLGTRYMFKKSFGIFGDVGIGMGSISFGLVDKF